jgi:AbiU2
MPEREKIGPVLAAEREARLSRWTGYVETIKHQVWELHHHRALWREMRQALLAASPEETTFLDHYARLYGERQLIALRRLVDTDSRTISLARLLTELSEHPATMTRGRHVELWSIPADPTDVRHEWLTKDANESFDPYADGDGDNVDPGQVAKDLDAWKSTCQKIKKIVDKRIAHFEAVDDTAIPTATYDDLDRAIDDVGKFISKYTLLFTASSIA